MKMNISTRPRTTPTCPFYLCFERNEDERLRRVACDSSLDSSRRQKSARLRLLVTLLRCAAIRDGQMAGGAQVVSGAASDRLASGGALLKRPPLFFGRGDMSPVRATFHQHAGLGGARALEISWNSERKEELRRCSVIGWRLHFGSHSSSSPFSFSFLSVSYCLPFSLHFSLFPCATCSDHQLFLQPLSYAHLFLSSPCQLR